MTTPSQPRDPLSFLPLKPDLFHILLALSEEELHGYGIMKAVEEATGGVVCLEPSPLYRRLKRLLDWGIVSESTGAPGRLGGDPRRRYYGLTRLGRQVLSAEAQRLVALAEDARIRKLAASAGRLA
ncbi:MAG: PadR family transcriptional regulator [Gemmatimonadota bacterium]